MMVEGVVGQQFSWQAGYRVLLVFRCVCGKGRGPRRGRATVSVSHLEHALSMIGDG